MAIFFLMKVSNELFVEKILPKINKTSFLILNVLFTISQECFHYLAR